MARVFVPAAIVLALAACGRIGFDGRAADRDADDISDTFDSGSDVPNTSVTVTVDGTGRVTSQPSGIDCPGTCTAMFGGSVTLTAETVATERFLGWDGSHCERSSVCTLTLDGEPYALSARFTGTHNLAFVSSMPFDPVGFTPDVADAACNSIAMAAGVPGRYVALLSSSGNNVFTRIGAADGWLAMDGLPIAAMRSELFDGNLLYTLRFDETGARNTTVAWTGSTTEGLVAAETCADWTSAASTSRVGLSDAIGASFASFTPLPCDFPRHVICLGIEKDSDVPVIAHRGRLAFVSTAWQPGAGLASADARCQADADGAALTGTFKALLFHEGGTPQSRFDLTGPTWVRRDGRRLYAAAQQLGGEPLTTLHQHADGSYTTLPFVFSGAPNKHCNNWTTTSGDVGGGQITRSAYFFNATYGASCSEALPIYCFEE